MSFNTLSRLLLLLLLAIGGTKAHANDTNYVINVEGKNGDILKYSFNDEPTFVLGKTITLKSKSIEIEDMEMAYEGIEKIFITKDDAPTSIGETITSHYTFMYNGNSACFGNVGENAKVSIAAADGKIVVAPVSLNGSDISIDLSSLTKGLYIIKVNNKSYKLLKK